MLGTFPWPRNVCFDIAEPGVTLMMFVSPCILMAGRGSGPCWLKAGSRALCPGYMESWWGASPVHLLPAATSLKLVAALTCLLSDILQPCSPVSHHCQSLG